MPDHPTTRVSSSSLVPELLGLLAAYREVTRQERVFVRVVMLSLGSVLALGRHTLSQILVTLGVSERDWTAWYRVFNRQRIALERVADLVVAQVMEVAEPGPVVAVVDATQLPRTSRRFPGVGVTVNPRGFKWRRPLHLAQRFVGVSVLLPRSAAGDSRAVPMRWLPLRTAKTNPFGDAPERTEREGALELITWLRARLDALGRAVQPLLVVGDGAYGTAAMLPGLPERTALIARCAKNRVLFAVPTPAAGRGRPRRYGERGPTPQALLQCRTGWRSIPVPVRGRLVTMRTLLTGPWVLKGAPDQPVLLVVIRGVDRGSGGTRRQRAPQFLLVSAVCGATGRWEPAVPLPEVLAWAWQRWEVEVMHRELKSSFGLGEPQAWSPDGATTTVSWLLWVYALVILAAYRTWGYRPPTGPDRGGWWRPRRWSVGRALQHVRAEVWQLGEFSPPWRTSPDTWQEMRDWTTTLTPAVLGSRRL